MVSFLYTWVSSSVPSIILNAMKGIILSSGRSIVSFRLGYRPFSVVGKSAVASVLGILARVPSTYLLYRGYHTFACEFVVEVAQKHIGH